MLADRPSLYYRLGDLASASNGQVAFDSSGNCRNGAYTAGSSTTPGAVTGDADSAAFDNQPFPAVIANDASFAYSAQAST